MNNNNNNFVTTKRPWFTTFICLLFLFMPIMIAGYVYSLFGNPISDTWGPNYDDETKINRTKVRGTIISILLTFGAAKQAIMKTVLKASETPLLLLYGFFMNAVIGYMGDQGFGKDDGYSLSKIVESMGDSKIKGFATTLKYIFGSLATYEFWRYIITVFLDMFISMPLQSIIVSVTENLINNLRYNVPFLWYPLQPVMNVLLQNYDNVLQSFVGFITFLAYTNDTRFTWAYPGNDIDSSKLISTGTIKLATAIAAIVYLIASVGADFNIVDGVKLKAGTALSDTLDRKLYFVLITIFLLTTGSMGETTLNGEIVPFFNFMNYSPSRYQILPLENYKTNSYWGIDVMKQNKIDTLIDNPNCKNGNISICKTNNITGDLNVDTNLNLDLIKSYRRLKETCDDRYDSELKDSSTSYSLNKGIIENPKITDYNKKHNSKSTFIISLCAALLCVLLIVLIIIFIGYKNYGSAITRYIFGFIFIFLLGCLFLSAKFAMNKIKSKSCSDDKEETYDTKVINKFLIDYKKEIMREYGVENDNEQYNRIVRPNLFTSLSNARKEFKEDIFGTEYNEEKYTLSNKSNKSNFYNQQFLNLSSSVGDDRTTYLIGTEAGPHDNSLASFLFKNNKEGYNSEYKNEKLFELFNRYTKSCIIVNKEMVSDCKVLRNEIIDDLVATYFENNKDAIKYYTKKITNDKIKSELKRVIKENEVLKDDINVLNDHEKFKEILKTDFKMPDGTSWDNNEKLLDLLSKMELRYNKNLGQLVKKIDMGVFMKPLNMINTKYDILKKSGLGFCILCLYCVIGYIVPFLPFVYGKKEKHNAAYWKVMLMTVIICGVLILLFIISSQSPDIEKIKEEELRILYEK